MTAITDEELKVLKKAVSSKKRVAMEWASQVHDLVEDRLLTDYRQLTELAKETVTACEAWQDAKIKYDTATK